jgi:ubiquinone/menaquinone biosynthesis C-methylase UbiE
MSNAVTYDAAGAERIERQYSGPSLVEQRRQTLEALALQPGEAALDIGCGPGYLTAEMAQRVGEAGRVLGIDTSQPMLDIARRRCASHGNVALERADAVRLPCQDASIDVAAAVQVYLFVPELEVALGELARVLRPGGRAVVVDTDWDSVVWHSSDDARMQRMLDTFTRRYFNARVARRIPGLLRRAGLRIEDAGAIPIVELAPTAESYSGSQIAELVRFVAGKNGISADEAAAWSNDQHELAARGAYFFALNRYLFLARKPA